MIQRFLGLKTTIIPSNNVSTEKTIIIDVVNSVIRKIDTVLSWQPNFIIYDEVHRYTGLHFQKVLEIPVFANSGNVKGKLGLTATMPDRNVEPYSYRILSENVGEVIYKYTISDAKNDELIAPFSLFVSHVGLTDEEQKELADINNRIMIIKHQITAKLQEKGIKFDVMKVLQKLLPVEYATEEVNLLRNSYLKRRHLNYKARFKIYNGCLTIEKILEKLPDEQIMIFTMSIKVAQEISEELEQNNISNKTIHSKNDSYDNECAIKSFKMKDLSVLISVRTMDEGIDIPHIRFIIIIANSKQIRQLIQRIGRTLRIDSKNPNKQSYIILFEVDGDEFDISEINKGATNTYYFTVDQINDFYQKLTNTIF